MVGVPTMHSRALIGTGFHQALIRLAGEMVILIGDGEGEGDRGVTRCLELIKFRWAGFET